MRIDTEDFATDFLMIVLAPEMVNAAIGPFRYSPIDQPNEPEDAFKYHLK